MARGGGKPPLLHCTYCGAEFERAAGLVYHLENKVCQVTEIVKPKTAEEICREAADLVGGSRQVSHGDKTINFKNTADFWNAALKAKWRLSNFDDPFPETLLLDPIDVGNMLELFKIARRYSGKHNIDDYIDGAGYSGCTGEVAEKEQLTLKGRGNAQIKSDKTWL